MDLRQLRYFVAVARERNFTRAAEALNIAQPPLSRQIQLLEEELGVALILRSSRPLRLTEAGRLFYEQALQVLGRVEQLAESTRRVGRNQNRLLSIGFVASTLYGGLPALVRKLRSLEPDLDIRLLELLSAQQVAALKEGRIDVGFGRLRYSDPAIASTTLRNERLIVALPRADPLAAASTPVGLAALAGQRLIIYPNEPRPSYADYILNLLRDAEVAGIEVQEVREIQTALGLVAAEAGICIIPRSASQMRSDVHYRPLADPQATSPIIISHRAGDGSATLETIRKLIAEMYAENPPWLDEDLGQGAV
ncbi:MAG: LysR family transcriptional regulator [Paracoccus sp. (in: a-proteobacteria)]|uniref:LysR family transcriptional regulator n=1 Tax=Paracoccus sp. TaxID=267 RepID=UPI0026E0A610|nr:LysR family transcriptional regulator [Paracoccus sp. (in: a-proteobacteria)]MDO5633205.1 LysR family transcriptional regulator [Paracoccus sp. (in: a-proteobacteria)]